MDRTYQGQQPARRRALADGSSRANKSSQSQRQEQKHHSDSMSVSSKPLPHNESILPSGTLAVRHEQHTPDDRRHSVTATLQPRPRNSKRDSEISNASTNASNTNRRRKTHIGPWQLGRTIGRGGCSRVRLVRHSATGQYGAAKIISKATAEKVRALSLANLIQSAEHDASLQADDKVIPFGLEREICIMKLLDHPHIVRLYDIWENRDELYLIMEYVEGGELFSYIHEQGGLIEIHVVHIFRQIIAALIYCHRINIHHRDLKPENILLDRDTMTVKLVDFGMAALQPSGKKLTTPCGSPHYAAPEVIKTISYDGGKADVWSCGVILYVLLTGTPPFNYSGEDRHLKDLFRDIQMARYVMPDNLSPEAKDLIRKILVVNPKHRIGLDDIWHHPFLSKYQQELKFVGASATQDHWTGPLPSIAEWASLERTTIDREILRYLRTLWHSEKEEVIIQRLMSNEANQEKYFYSALRKYQNDQLENYQPSAHHTVAKSNSDYHHSARHHPTDDDVAELPTQKHTRSQSGYSILNNEHLYSKHSFYESPVSVASYDPFRASKQPMMPDQGCINQNVTVHRGQSKDSNRSKKRPTTALGHYQNISSLRVQALRNNSKHSAASGSSSYRSTPSHRRSGSIKRQSMSRLSLASSNWASSPPVVARPGRMGRRGVSFSRLRHRRPSAATASTVEDSPKVYSSDDSTPINRPHTSIGSYDSSARSRSNRSSAVQRSKSRCSTSAETPRLRLRKPESPSKYIQSEARKVSTELGKAMEEAFNRASISSSIQTITTDRLQDLSQYDTPPTSFTNTRDSGGSFLATPSTKPGIVQRPLPPTPNETPNTFVHRKLAETRAEIARRLNEECDNAEHFNEVLENLDRLMLPPVNTKRVVSAPARSPEHPVPLHAIPEEKIDAPDRFGIAYDAKYRAVTDPLRPIGRRAVTATEQQTIRLVDQSPTRIAPLNIRKRSNASTESKTSSKVEGPSKTGPAQQQMPVRAFEDVHKELLAAKTIETAQPAQKKETVVKKKKSLWFRRSAEEKASEHEEKENQAKKKASADFPHIPEAWQRLDDRIKNATASVHPASAQPVKRSDDSEFPIRESNGPTAKSESAMRKGFLAFFGKKSKEDKNKRTMELGANFSTSSILSGFDLGLENSNDTIARTGPPEMQMNWLSRFLHIKPATKTLCFRTGRGKVRQDLVRLLRDWQRFGVRDVVFNRESNVINARIDKLNHLKMKPVSFVIELFVVLEHGRRANLCLARFTQTRGAASSFSKVVDIVEDVCRARNMLIEDDEKKAAMMEVLD